jgi:DNA-binding CsgD family transcriptional regulator
MQTEPVYAYKNEEVKVTLYLQNPDILLSRKADLNDRQRQLLLEFASQQGFSSRELARHYKVSKDTILNDLDILGRIINIVEEGNGRNTRYRWIKQ